MAKAPTRAQVAAARGEPEPGEIVFKVTIAGEERSLCSADLGPKDDLISQQQATRPISVVLADPQAVAPGNALIVWWFAGWKAGDRTPFRVILDRFETYADMEPYDFDRVEVADAADDTDPVVADDPL